MRKRYKDGHVEAASGEVTNTRRITNTTRTETPIVRVIGRIGKDTISPSKPKRRDTMIRNLAGIIKSQRAANVSQIDRNVGLVPSWRESFAK